MEEDKGEGDPFFKGKRAEFEDAEEEMRPKGLKRPRKPPPPPPAPERTSTGCPDAMEKVLTRSSIAEEHRVLMGTYHLGKRNQT